MKLLLVLNAVAGAIAAGNLYLGLDSDTNKIIASVAGIVVVAVSAALGMNSAGKATE